MKFLKRICSRLNRFLSPQPGKNGSSMAFVMIIGAVLVIWVLAIMPLMVAVGNNSLSLQGSYADYLQSRSAIEFCKGELEKMVETKPPYTFCVVKNGDAYKAIPKLDSISLSRQYDDVINRDPDAIDNIINDNVDTDDIPEESDAGKTVAAICAVQQRADETNIYDIIITTYNNGHKSLTYSTVYTIRGTLKINPESYLKSQALPLSDFVVVDGKLGGDVIWNSTIHDSNMTFEEGKYNSVTNLNSIMENLLPYDSGSSPLDGYADAGEFPAVFKTTAYPSGVTKPNPFNGSKFILVSTSNNAVYADGNRLKVQKNFDISDYRNNPDSFDKYQWTLVQEDKQYKLYNENAKKYLKETYTEDWLGRKTYSYSLTDTSGGATKFTITYNNGTATIKADRYLNITSSKVEPSKSSTSIYLVTRTTEGTPVDSVLKGTSLYFMGRDGSIDTKGKTVHLFTDLIVLRHDIKSNGSVMVYPYSDELNTYDPNDTDPDTLLFAVNDIKNASGKVVFKALTFYRIPAGTDINKITDAEAVNLHPLNINNDIDKLKLLLRSEDYPEINMDIAYIDREGNKDKNNNNQLAHIVSGETIGWTEKGKLVGGEDENFDYFYEEYTSRNRQFVVCAYITEVSNTTISRTANRILIAADEEANEDGTLSRTLRVPNSLTFTCRYFSITADKVIQSMHGNNYGSLQIANLGQNSSLIEDIKNILEISSYHNKTLQIDFELPTEVTYLSGFYHQQGIYRISVKNDETLNLFGPYEVQPLMVTYTNTEIEGWMNGVSNEAHIVDRYLTLTSTDPNKTELLIDSTFESTLEVFTSYIYFDNSVDKYIFAKNKRLGMLSASGIKINSQERGYESEYLGFFTNNSLESYNGTIIFIEPDDIEKPLGEGNGGIYIVKRKTSWIDPDEDTETFIPSGFYFIPATPKGTDLLALTDLGSVNNTENKPWAIDPEDLDDYSIYIKKNGTMSNEYVDTGLIGNGDLGESGFSGGNVG